MLYAYLPSIWILFFLLTCIESELKTCLVALRAICGGLYTVTIVVNHFITQGVVCPIDVVYISSVGAVKILASFPMHSCLCDNGLSYGHLEYI